MPLKDIYPKLKDNEKYIKQVIGNSDDVIFTKFNIKLPEDEYLDAFLFAIDGIVDDQIKRDSLLKPLQLEGIKERPNKNLDKVQDVIQVKDISVEKDLNKAINAALNAQIVLFVDGYKEALIIKGAGFEVRSISEPLTEQVIRGSGEGFIENNAINLTMVRRRIVNPNLRFESYKLGELTQTEVTVAYIKGVAKAEFVKKIKDRIQKIKIDALNNDGELEQLIEDHPYSIFATVGNTERPDKVAYLLVEGRVVIFVNGSPVTLFAPNLFLESFISTEDYVSRPYYSSLIRIIRFFAFILCIISPGLYITAINFEKNLIPSDMIVPIIQARELVPFPLVIEVLISILLYEIVREAGVRLPKQIGSALSIVGALILGEVSVSAGLVGAPTVVAVSISYIAGFVITPIADTIALLRIVFIFAAAMFGSYGLVVASLFLLMHMVTLTSFGIPYMAPFSPLHFRDLKDAIVRFPTRLLRHRSRSIPSEKDQKLSNAPETGGRE